MRLHLGEWAMAGTAIGLATGIAFATMRCAPGTTVPPQVVDTGICILERVSEDLLAGLTIQVALEDAATRCLGSPTPANVAQVQAIWSAHLAAEVRLHDAGK
jgi:hypothetical protein